MSFRVGVNPTLPTEVFRDGVGAYRHYRIPSLVTTPSNVVLALAEGRMQKNDHGWVDIVYRTSLDATGTQWGPLCVLYSESNRTHWTTTPTLPVPSPRPLPMRMPMRRSSGGSARAGRRGSAQRWWS